MRILLNLAPQNSKNGKAWLKQSKLLAVIVRQALEALIFANRFYLRMHHIPPLYQCGIRYAEEPEGQPYEDFAAVPVVLARKCGDCDDLVSWRIAELRNAGENAKVRLKWQYDLSRGSRMYHVLVRRADGTVEDPSLRLGMGTHTPAGKTPGRMTP